MSGTGEKEREGQSGRYSCKEGTPRQTGDAKRILPCSDTLKQAIGKIRALKPMHRSLSARKVASFCGQGVHFYSSKTLSLTVIVQKANIPNGWLLF